MKHVPVMLNDVTDVLGDIRGQHIIDATFGAGGYSRAFLNAGAVVTAFDRDSHVISDANAIKQEFGSKFTFINEPFSHMCNLNDSFDAIVFDLGISSMQIDNAERGFSFRFDAPLDMRMSDSGPTVAELFDVWSVSELTKILRDFGDVKPAGAIANAVKKSMPKTTFELKDLIHNPKDIAPVFQALRIAVNDEFGETERALQCVPRLLNPGGRCICVTFHSIEDRIVKNTFRDWTAVIGDPRVPTNIKPGFTLIRPRTPSKHELESNPRARSAHLRGVVKSY
ncbi:MAG: 16S rRNA (cytosine(1402)-N(4))-methyltransferase RsmH [Alphaproteobacteria bacterium]|nr:16S rRNA (cytosine(1402)-N(4))-methyltransferase RsmH [Alphaproteobacteria bacterium]